jgi:hypothetical protein
MERQVQLVARNVHRCVRIALVLPQEGNDTNFMAIDRGDPGFDILLAAAERTAEHVIAVKETERIKQDRQRRYQQYLSLKEEFESDNLSE